MEKIAPLGPVYQAGTLSGNPVAVSAGLATLERLDAAVYDKLEHLGARLERGLVASASKRGVDVCVQRVGSMITMFFTKGPVRTFADAIKSDTKRFGRWHGAMLSRGQYWPPSQFEAAFLGNTHDEALIDATLAAADEALAASA
jgi:glutamate-1-semialdehyde 2,1-aminomutase